MENMGIDSYSSFNYRFNRYFMVMLLLPFLSLLAVLFFFAGFYFKNSFFSVCGILFIVTLFLNLLVYRKRARFYLKDFSATVKEIVFTYYDRDNLKTAIIPWGDINFYIGSTQNERYLAVWERDELLFLIFRTFADHGKKFTDLKNAFEQYVPKERMKVNKKFFAGDHIYTKKFRYALFS